jgi:DNA-binding MarR family transcriptional regulator
MPRKPYYAVDNLRCRKSVGYLVRRLHNLMLPQVEGRFADAELTFTQWVTLMGLREGLVKTCVDIARHLGHDTGATTRMLDQLEARGLVERTRDTSDRRVINIALTTKGKAMAKKQAPRMVDFWNTMLVDFSPAEADTLIDLLTRLLSRIEREAVANELPARTRAAR